MKRIYLRDAYRSVFSNISRRMILWRLALLINGNIVNISIARGN